MNIFEVMECKNVDLYLGLPTFVDQNEKGAF